MPHSPTEVARRGIIEWNSEPGTVTRGPEFEEIEPTVRLLAANRGALPGEFLREGRSSYLRAQFSSRAAIFRESQRGHASSNGIASVNVFPQSSHLNSTIVRIMVYHILAVAKLSFIRVSQNVRARTNGGSSTVFVGSCDCRSCYGLPRGLVDKATVLYGSRTREICADTNDNFCSGGRTGTDCRDRYDDGNRGGRRKQADRTADVSGEIRGRSTPGERAIARVTVARCGVRWGVLTGPESVYRSDSSVGS